MDLISIIQIAGCLIAAFSKSSVSRNIEHRIFDGYKATIYDFPYMLSLQKMDRQKCGAAVIGAHYALTAAHCIGDGEDLSFRSGSSFKSSGGRTHKIKTMDIHVRGNFTRYMGDIALIYVEEPFITNDSVARAVILPNSSYVPPPGVNAIATGWGLCGSCPLSHPEQFNAVELPLIPKSKCKTLYPTLNTQMEICTGYEHIQKGTSKGDSGGPLVINGVLIGIVSWGYFAYPMAEKPEVYADVVSLSDWVRSKMAKIESEKK